MVAAPALNPALSSLKLQGDKAYSSRDFGSALESYSEALEITEDAVVFSNRSAAHGQRRAFDKALADADRALLLAPDWPRAHHRRGHALFYLGRYQEAVQAFERGAALDPGDGPLKEALARAREYTEPVPGRASRPAAAESTPATASTVPRPRRAGAFSATAAQRAGAGASPGGYPSPAPAASKAAPAPSAPPQPAGTSGEPRPTGPVTQYVIVYQRVALRKEPSVQAEALGVKAKDAMVTGQPFDVDGLPWLKLRDDGGWMLMDGKTVGLGTLVELAGNGPSAEELREKGNQLFRDGKHSAAVRTYTQAIDRDPEDARLYANRAAASMALLQEFGTNLTAQSIKTNSYYQSALQDLQQALKMDPNYVKAYARLGQLHLRVGNRSAAEQAFTTGLRLDPESPECQRGRDSLKS